MESVLQIIQQYGFPIAACVFLFILLQNEQKQHKEESEKSTAAINDLKVSFNAAINEQQKCFSEAIQNNTLVMQQLVDMLRKAE